MNEPTQLSIRKAAAARGEKRYNTGKPCKFGHFSDRQTSSGACVACITVSVRKPSFIQESFEFKSWVAKDLTPQERIDLEIYLWHCLIVYCEDTLKKPAPINRSTMQWAIANRKSPHESPH